jgi:hypothetical protein
MIRRCAAFVNAHMQSAGSSKLEAWLTVPDFFELRASSLLPQAYICLG